MRIKAGLIYDPIYKEHLTPKWHEESPERLTRILNYLKDKGLLNEKNLLMLKPRRASIDEVTEVHDVGYVNYVKKLCGSGIESLDEDTYLSKRSFEVALYAIGGVLEGCESVLSGKVKNAFALVRPPGHHAGVRGRAMGVNSQGFCIFNNVAVAAKFLLNKGLKRIVIFDFDCHHGNGTQEIFESFPNVLYMSIHQDPMTIYPGTGFIDQVGSGEGAGFKVNVPLPPLSGDDAYSLVMEEIFRPLVHEFRPEFILVSAGYDAYDKDPLTSMRASLHTFKLFSREVVESSEKYCNGRAVFSLEGGYSEGLQKGVYITLNEMSGIEVEIEEERNMSGKAVFRRAEDVVNEVKRILRDFWSLG